MASYEPVRNSSPIEQNRLGGGNRLRRNDIIQPNGMHGDDEGGDAADQRLLSDHQGDIEEATVPPELDVDRAWLLPGLTAVTFIAMFVLGWLLLSLDQTNKELSSEHDDGLHPLLRRPESEYVLDPSWDFMAPSQVRSYNWTITDRDGNPDGVYKPMMTINGKFPGPMIEVNEGDIIEVNVSNRASNATAIHWHGVFQNGSNWMDGAAGVTQCPIASRGSYQYRYNVTGQSGTYFYHGHQGVQALDGLVGPLVVHSRHEAADPRIPYSSDRVILLQDWYYDPASGLMRDVLSPGVEDAPIPNAALINGVNHADCSSHRNRRCSDLQGEPLPRLDLAQGENHRLRFLNVGGYAWFQVAVDDHEALLVIEIDGTTVEPAPGSTLLLAPGQRYSVVLTADRTDGEAFWLRARMVTACFAEQTLPENGIDEAKAVVRYLPDRGARRHDDEPLPLPTTNSKLEFLSTCKDMSATASFSPLPPQEAPNYADHSWYLRVNLAIGDWRLQRGVLNSSSFRPNLKSPTLHRVLDGLSQKNESFAMKGVNTAAFDTDSELVISHNAVETVDIVLQNMDENSHPFHLHGMPMWVLGAGHGYFPGYEALGLRAEGKGLLDPTNSSVVDNPLKRDTVTVEGFGWVLLRFVADNPGVWLFHCHMIWHSETGMGMQFLSRLDVMRQWNVPGEARKLCDAPEGELRKGAPPRDEVFFGFDDDER